MSRYAPSHSHHLAVRKAGGLAGFRLACRRCEGIDTRLLVQKLRSKGTVQGALVDEEPMPQVGLAQAPGIAMRDAVDLVEPHSIVELPGSASGPTILVIDTGAKSR